MGPHYHQYRRDGPNYRQCRSDGLRLRQHGQDRLQYQSCLDWEETAIKVVIQMLLSIKQMIGQTSDSRCRRLAA